MDLRLFIQQRDVLGDTIIATPKRLIYKLYLHV